MSPVRAEEAVARFARDILGFHDARGGVLIVGVTDKGIVHGIHPSHVKDSTALQQVAERYVGKGFPIFFEVIDLPIQRVLWLVFVKGRGDAQPRACLRDGPPIGSSGQREVKKGGLYLRVNDQVKSCTQPDDLAKLFAGYSLYMFIISLSAKHKLWHGDETHSRRASFVGLSDFLSEIATVLEVPYCPDIAELEMKVIDAMSTYEGLLLLDNLEEIDDQDLLTFISTKIPDPVKTIVTTRIDKGLGAYTITIPEMDDLEAAELLCSSLEEKGVPMDRERDAAAIHSILEITAKVPLALIWAAGVVKRKGSIKEALTELSKFTHSKSRFLEFCFRTMWEDLSETAQRVGMLRGYLGERCTQSTCALILDPMPEREISAAIIELRDCGLLLSPTHVDEMRFLSLTQEFLLKRWKDSASFQRWAQPRIAAADENMCGALLEDKPADERASAMVARAGELLRDGNATMARRVIDLALRWTSAASARFLAGRIRYEQGQHDAGLLLMRDNIDGDTEASDRLYVAHALRERGTDEDLRETVKLAEPLVRDERTGAKAREIVLDAALRTNSIATLTRVLDIDPDDALVETAPRELAGSLVEPAFLARWGPALLPSMERVERWSQDRSERTLMRNAVRNVKAVFQ